MANKLTERAQQVISTAREAARHSRGGWVEPAHILLGLLDLDESTAHKILLRENVDIKSLRRRVEGSVPSAIAEIYPGEIKFSPHALRVLEFSNEEVQWASLEFLGTEHLLLGLFRVEGTAEFLRETGLSMSSCRQLIPELSGRMPQVVIELSFEATKSRVKLLATGEVEIHGLSPGGSLGSIMARFNDLEGFEGYISVVKDDWLDSKDVKLGTREQRIALLNWIADHALPELKKVNLHPGEQ